MQVVFHLGVHATDEDRLLRSLLRNRETLSRLGVAIPAPGRYRTALRETLQSLQGGAASSAAQKALLSRIADSDAPRRIVFSHDSFLCMASRALSPEGFYARAGRQVAAMSRLFDGADCEFHLALRNPATLVPALMARTEGADYSAFMHDLDPLRLSWVPVVQALRHAVPDARLVVWCNEDSPVLWPDLVRCLAGTGAETALCGGTDLVDQLITPAGRNGLEAALAANPPSSPAGLRAVLASHLEQHARPGALDAQIALPGWDDALVADMTASYDADIAEIGAMKGVDLVLP